MQFEFLLQNYVTPPPPNKITPRTKIKISDPRSSKDFFEIFNPPSKLEGGRGACPTCDFETQTLICNVQQPKSSSFFNFKNCFTSLSVQSF